MKNNHDILLPLLRDEFYNSFPPLTRGVKIVLSGLGDYLGDMAAASLVMPHEWVEAWSRTDPWKKSTPKIDLK